MAHSFPSKAIKGVRHSFLPCDCILSHSHGGTMAWAGLSPLEGRVTLQSIYKRAVINFLYAVDLFFMLSLYLWVGADQ